jgi:hypothetical protein
MPRSPSPVRLRSFRAILGSPKASADSFCDHRSLKLSEHAHHLKHRLAARRCGVQALLVQKHGSIAIQVEEVLVE